MFSGSLQSPSTRSQLSSISDVTSSASEWSRDYSRMSRCDLPLQPVRTSSQCVSVIGRVCNAIPSSSPPELLPCHYAFKVRAEVRVKIIDGVYVVRRRVQQFRAFNSQRLCFRFKSNNDRLTHSKLSDFFYTYKHVASFTKQRIVFNM